MRLVCCRHDIIVALDHEVRRDIISMTQSEWHTYYEDKVSVLNQFSQCCGGNILRTGGSALLERELSSIVRPVVQKNRKDSRGSRQSGGGQQIQIPDVLRPSLSKGKTCQSKIVVQHCNTCKTAYRNITCRQWQCQLH